MLPIPEDDIEAENIGSKIRVYQLYNCWKHNDATCYGRSTHYAEVTADGITRK